MPYDLIKIRISLIGEGHQSDLAVGISNFISDRWHLICKVVKRAENNKDTVEKHGTGCDKNYFNVSNEQMAG